MQTLKLSNDVIVAINKKGHREFRLPTGMSGAKFNQILPKLRTELAMLTK